jgi:hypothetical protein
VKHWHRETRDGVNESGVVSWFQEYPFEQAAP